MPQVIISSDFTTDADGWTATGANLIFAHETEDGNPGGHILISDLGTGGSVAHFSAPAKFRGDMSAFIGGELEFDIFFTDRLTAGDGREIRLVGGGLTIFRPLNADFDAEDQWNDELHPLERQYWVYRPFGQSDRNPTEAEFLQVLSDLDQILIKAEFLSDPLGGGGQEETRLDNFMITSPGDPPQWRRLDSAQQTEGEFETFAEAVAQATSDDVLVFVNPAQTALELGNVRIAIDGLTVSGGSLLDATFILGSGVEDFTLDGLNGADVIGNALRNVIVGSDGDNTIKSGLDADVLKGGGGNDRYYVDHPGDYVWEYAGEGTDTVYTTTSFLLNAHSEVNSEVEFLRAYKATEGLGLFGNELAQSIFGSAYNDELGGGGGLDILRGLGGDDIYVVNNAGVRAIEGVGQGDDTVLSTVDFVLGHNVENLELRGSYAIKGIGNDLGNLIDGSDKNNVLRGNGGSDVLTGNGGSDNMYGGTEADVFVLGAPNSGIDIVRDWSASDQDLLAVIGSEFGLDPGTLSGDRFADKTPGMADSLQARFLWDDATDRLFWDADGNATTTNATIARILNADISASDFLIL